LATVLAAACSGQPAPTAPAATETAVTSIASSASPGPTASGDHSPAAALAAFQAFVDNPQHTYRAMMRAPSGSGTEITYQLTVAGADVDLVLTSGATTLHMRKVGGRGYAETPSGWTENQISLPTIDLASEPWWYLGSIADLRPVTAANDGDTVAFEAPAPYSISAQVLGSAMPATTVTRASLVLHADGRPVWFSLDGAYPDGQPFSVSVTFSDVGGALSVEAPSPLAG
jgi:hypothetical protein